MPPKKTYLTVTEAAKLLGVSRQSVSGAIKRGIIQAEKGPIETIRLVKTIQQGLRIPISELKKYRPSDLHVWLGKKKQ
jgi:DNA-binding XRE family transcriptional regulator